VLCCLLHFVAICGILLRFSILFSTLLCCVAQITAGVAPANVITEGWNDLYPFAGLLSGYHQGYDWCNCSRGGVFCCMLVYLAGLHDTLERGHAVWVDDEFLWNTRVKSGVTLGGGIQRDHLNVHGS